MFKSFQHTVMLLPACVPLFTWVFLSEISPSSFLEWLVIHQERVLLLLLQAIVMDCISVFFCPQFLVGHPQKIGERWMRFVVIYQVFIVVVLHNSSQIISSLYLFLAVGLWVGCSSTDLAWAHLFRVMELAICIIHFLWQKTIAKRPSQTMFVCIVKSLCWITSANVLLLTESELTKLIVSSMRKPAVPQGKALWIPLVKGRGQG